MGSKRKYCLNRWDKKFNFHKFLSFFIMSESVWSGIYIYFTTDSQLYLFTYIFILLHFIIIF